MNNAKTNQAEKHENSATAMSAAAQPGRPGWVRKAGMLAGVVAVSVGLAACGHHRDRLWGSDDDGGSERIAKVVNKMFGKVDATDEQKAQITEIATRTLETLRPMKSEMRATKEMALELLAAPTIDAEKVEALRASRIVMADEASKIMTQGMIDIAAILTPEQRAEAQAKIRERMDHHGGDRS